MELCPVEFLSPLQVMPLVNLNMAGAKIRDLSPLKGMKLISSRLNQTPADDLSPLKDIPLRVFDLDLNPRRDRELLRSLKSLKTVNGKPAAEAMKRVAKRASR